MIDMTEPTPTCPRCGGPLELIDITDIVDTEPRFVTNGRCARECWREDDDSIAATSELLRIMVGAIKEGQTFDEIAGEHGPELSAILKRIAC